MIEFLGTLAYDLLIELFLASALVWAMAVVIIRFLRITNPAWRVRFHLLPILIPVFVVPLVHVLIRPICPWIPSTIVEDFMGSLINLSPLVTAVSFGIAGLILFSGVIYTIRPLAAAVRYRKDWRRQCNQQSSSWLRCNNMLQSMVSRLRMSPARLILTGSSSCGSLAFGLLGSYIVVSEDLIVTLDDEELESLLAHELSHIKRKDTLSGIVVGVCHRLLTFSPFARNAYRGFCQAREELVDDLAIHTGGRPLALASCLVKAYRLRQGQDCNEPSTGFFSSISAAENRIQRLLEDTSHTAKPPQVYWLSFFGVIAVILILLHLLV